jgi:hypothetical protein
MRIAAALLCVLVAPQLPSRPPDIPFRMHAIDPGASETAAVADINRDGRLDIVSGEYWYEQPAARTASGAAWPRHRFRTLGFSNQYIDNFSDLVFDVDGDGDADVVSVSWFAKKVAWWRNPSTRAVTPGARSGQVPSSRPSLWKEEPIHEGFNVEFAILADVDNDGKAHEVVAQENGTGQAWYRFDGAAWQRHQISEQTYGHGIGAGDVNGDQRTDILTPRGWLEAPADPRSGGWTFHRVWESINLPVTHSAGSGQAHSAGSGQAHSTGSGQAPASPPKPGAPPRVSELGFMHVLDVNGDSRNDVIAAAGHDYGVFWFEHGENGVWTRRNIDTAWSQGHASTLADLNGDGRPDFVTGKRFMAHNGSDPGEREPLGVYWYEFRGREAIRHLIDYGGRIGAGMQLPVVDIDGDGDLDVVCPGKSGLFLAENRTQGR